MNAETTQVWMTVFSWRVNGCLRRPIRSTAEVQRRTKKKPSSPAETLSDGMIPVVRFSFMTITLNMTASSALTTNARSVSCSLHDGTALSANTRSTDVASGSSAPPLRPPPPCSSAPLPAWRCRSVLHAAASASATSSSPPAAAAVCCAIWLAASASRLVTH
uniref:Uncharacterized protein n=1 Tax=Oryza meridionalis TaxID=40149 RepID=A0A0E0CNT7_9ORYZ